MLDNFLRKKQYKQGTPLRFHRVYGIITGSVTIEPFTLSLLLPRKSRLKAFWFSLDDGTEEKIIE